MGKNKLHKFQEMDAFPHVFQCSYNELRQGADFHLKGRWNRDFFKNENPIVLELGCGKGEYTVGLASLYPECNFIGIDIKGARIWTGAKASFEKQMPNVAFLRTGINLLTEFFERGEIDEIWLTFPDPQMKKVRKRLTSANFLALYAKLLKPDGIVHLKTDSRFMFTYTSAIVRENHYDVLFCTENLYESGLVDEILSIKTFYEQQWLSRNITIKYLKFRIKEIPEIIEPCIEIEPDSYRSFGRNRRTESYND